MTQDEKNEIMARMDHFHHHMCVVYPEGCKKTDEERRSENIASLKMLLHLQSVLDSMTP